MKIVCVERGGERWRHHFEVDMQNAFSLVNKWNSLFSISYVKFRKELRKTHDQSVTDAQFDDVIELCDPASLNMIKEPGYLFVPTDDDDWFSPRLVQRIRDCDFQNHKALRWNFARLSHSEFSVQGQYRHDCPDVFRYQTNNYAIVSPCDIDVLKNHAVCDRIYDSSDELFVDETLSVQNWNLSSRSLHWQMPLSLKEHYELFKKAEIPESIPIEFIEMAKETKEIHRRIGYNRIL